jgi:hypothetical protein
MNDRHNQEMRIPNDKESDANRRRKKKRRRKKEVLSIIIIIFIQCKK